MYLKIFAYIHYLWPHFQFCSFCSSSVPFAAIKTYAYSMYTCMCVVSSFFHFIPCAYPHQSATLVTRNFMATANLVLFYLKKLVILRRECSATFHLSTFLFTRLLKIFFAINSNAYEPLFRSSAFVYTYICMFMYAD